VKKSRISGEATFFVFFPRSAGTGIVTTDFSYLIVIEESVVDKFFDVVGIFRGDEINNSAQMPAVLFAEGMKFFGFGPGADTDACRIFGSSQSGHFIFLVP
jgi:hypothetical protein